jgi:hypothetical protein
MFLRHVVIYMRICTSLKPVTTSLSSPWKKNTLWARPCLSVTTFS